MMMKVNQEECDRGIYIIPQQWHEEQENRRKATRGRAKSKIWGQFSFRFGFFCLCDAKGKFTFLFDQNILLLFQFLLFWPSFNLIFFLHFLFISLFCIQKSINFEARIRIREWNTKKIFLFCRDFLIYTSLSSSTSRSSSSLCPFQCIGHFIVCTENRNILNFCLKLNYMFLLVFHLIA